MQFYFFVAFSFAIAIQGRCLDTLGLVTLPRQWWLYPLHLLGSRHALLAIRSLVYLRFSFHSLPSIVYAGGLGSHPLHHTDCCSHYWCRAFPHLSSLLFWTLGLSDGRLIHIGSLVCFIQPAWGYMAWTKK